MTTSSGKVYCDDMINKQTSPFKNYSVVLRFCHLPLLDTCKGPKFSMGFLGPSFWSGDFWVSLQAQGIFVCFNLCPYSHLT